MEMMNGYVFSIDVLVAIFLEKEEDILPII
jgi:hypothetical protein